MTLTIREMVEILRRANEARELRIQTGLWMHVVEVRIRDRSQMAALREHVDEVVRDEPDLATRMFGIAVVCDEEVERGMIRLVFEDGSFDDRPLR